MTREAVGYVAEHVREATDLNLSSIEQDTRFGATQEELKAESIHSTYGVGSNFNSPRSRANKRNKELFTIMDKMYIPASETKLHGRFNRESPLPSLPNKYQSIT